MILPNEIKTREEVGEEEDKQREPQAMSLLAPRSASTSTMLDKNIQSHPESSSNALVTL